jgi:tetratricopeptide (TPR) repeat protein
MIDSQQRRLTWLIACVLGLAVLVAYAPLRHAGFINYDDPAYVSANPHVQAGLTADGIGWALTTGQASNWHPVTWISHMIDGQLYGMNPLGHHVTNVLLHLANSVLLFLLLQRMTKATTPSAIVAALFALHPTHVESVAWISERKDVLSTLFWMLTLLTYARAMEKKPAEKRFFTASIILFGVGLAAKPMLVTLPFVLLLLDYWPLQRREIPWRELVLEKKAFFILAAISCLITFFVQAHGGSVMNLDRLPVWVRLANVPVSYLRYVGKTFWPAHLAIAYPYTKWPLWEVAGALVVVLAFSAFAVRQMQAQPWIAVGWFWFLGTLVPVIGIVQVGVQAMADRYNYIPSIGLLVAIVWIARSQLGDRVVAIVGVVASAICLVLTVQQSNCWQNDQTVFQNAIDNSSRDYIAFAGLGEYEALHGETNAALDHLERSIEINPNYPFARNNLGRLLLMLGREDDALAQLQKAVALDPKFPDSRYNLGYVLLSKGRVGEALDQFQAQVDLEPDDFRAENNMGTVLLQNGLATDAMRFLKNAIKIEPGEPQPHYSMGNALYRTGNVSAAVAQYEKCLQIKPDHVQACNNLAWIFACSPDPSLRNGSDAVELATRADQLTQGQNAIAIGTLAAAYAESGQFPQAVETEKRACEVALAKSNAKFADVLRKRLDVYESGSPWRDIAAANNVPKSGN